jgi:His-Xaa-Ser system protein HxsD
MTTLPWTTAGDNGSLSMTIDTSIYPVDVVERTCFAFTARAYVFMVSCAENAIRVDIAPKEHDDDAAALAGEFGNALLEQSLRARIAAETRTIRELIVAQAFCEGDLLDRRDSEAEPDADPRHIAARR